MRMKLFTVIIVFVLLASISTAVYASAPVASVAGPSTIRAGDTITIKVMLNGTAISAVQGEIKYDSTKLTYKSSAGILAGWVIDIDGTSAGKVKFLGIDDKLAAPINSNKQLFTLTFQIKSTVATGTNIKISAEGLAASDGNSDFTPANASYSVNTAAPLSANANLSALTISNATISPAFGKDTITYSASVPFATSKLDIVTITEDSKAKASVSGNNLTPGGTTAVVITVTAENGSKKSYTINVTREADPNYIPSNNTSLSGITAGVFLLSPVFNPDITEYVIWLPTETSAVAVSGNAVDTKASVTVVGGDALVAGQDNPITITCTAEDGSTKEYVIIAKRAAAAGNQNSSEESSAVSSQNTESSVVSDDSPNASDSGTPIWVVLIIALLCFGAGIAGGYIFTKKSNASSELDGNSSTNT